MLALTYVKQLPNNIVDYMLIFLTLNAVPFNPEPAAMEHSNLLANNG